MSVDTLKNGSRSIFCFQLKKLNNLNFKEKIYYFNSKLLKKKIEKNLDHK